MCPERKHIQGEQWVKTHGVQGDFHSKGDGSAMLLKRKKKVNEVREKPPPLGVLWENPGSPSQGGSSVSALAAPHAWTQRGPPFLTLPPPSPGKGRFCLFFGAGLHLGTSWTGQCPPSFGRNKTHCTTRTRSISPPQRQTALHLTFPRSSKGISSLRAWRSSCPSPAAQEPSGFWKASDPSPLLSSSRSAPARLRHQGVHLSEARPGSAVPSSLRCDLGPH